MQDKFQLGLMVLCAMTIVGQAAAAGEMQDFHAALTAHYRDAQEAVAAKDAKRWGQQYATDAVVVGEGYKEAVHGRDALMPTLESLVKGIKHCSIKPEGDHAGQEMGYSFATWTCTPEKVGDADFFVRSLYVWKRGTEGWKVVAEMYGMGQMEAAVAK